MAWIELHQSTSRHPKILRLAIALGVHRQHAVGLLADLWCWALDAKPNGGPLEEIDLRTATDWFTTGAPDLAPVLVSAGLLDARDDGLWIHDWDDYAGRLIRQREAAKKRARAARGKSVPRTATGTFADRTRTDGRSYAHDRDSYPSTEPYRTEPIETEITRPRARTKVTPIRPGGWDDLPAAATAIQRLTALRLEMDARTPTPREEIELDDLAALLTPEDVTEIRRRSDGKPWAYARAIAGGVAADRRLGRDPWRDRAADGAGRPDAGGAGGRGVRGAGRGRRPTDDGGAPDWEAERDGRRGAAGVPRGAGAADA